MFCNFCGRELREGMAFCPECGTKVVTESEPVPSMEPINEKTELISEDQPDKGPIGEQMESAEEQTASESVSEQPIPADDDEKTVFLGAPNQEQEEETVYITDQEAENEMQDKTAPQEQSSSGTNTSDVLYCPNCGTMNKKEDLFCASCGASLDGSTPALDAAAAADSKAAGSKARTGGKSLVGKVAAAVGVLLVAAAVVFVIIGVFPFSSKKDSKYYYYVKDYELCRGNYRSGKTAVIDDDVVDDGYRYGFDTEVSKYIDYYFPTQLTEDGKYLVYPRDIGENCNLYCVEPEKKKAEPVKIGSDVVNYYITSGNRIVYLDYKDALYVSDVKGNKEKVSKEVNGFWVSADGKKLLWTTKEDQKMYVQDITLKEDKVKLDSEVLTVKGFSNDMKLIVYTKDQDGSLYVMRNMSEREKISSNVNNVAVSDIDGKFKIIYTKKKDSASQLTVMDFIEDDMAAADGAMKEPRIEDYQHTEEVQSFWGMKTQTITDEAYYEEVDKYYEKTERDQWRERFKNTTIDLDGYYVNVDVILYDGERRENTAVQEDIWTSDGAYSFENQAGGGEEFVGLYTYFTDDELPKVKFSKIVEEDSYYDVSGILEEEVEKSIVTALQIDGKVRNIDLGGKILSQTRVDSDKQKIYLLLREEAGGEGELVRMGYGSKDTGEFETLDEDVERIVYLSQGKLYYLKELDSNGCGDLYSNGKKIDSDVYSVAGSGEDHSKILYLADYDQDTYSYTLKLYGGKEPEKIESDVYDFVYVNDSKILLLTDYSVDRENGELKVFDGKKVNAVDSDVNYLIHLPRQLSVW